MFARCSGCAHPLRCSGCVKVFSAVLTAWSRYQHFSHSDYHLRQSLILLGTTIYKSSTCFTAQVCIADSLRKSTASVWNVPVGRLAAGGKGVLKHIQKEWFKIYSNLNCIMQRRHGGAKEIWGRVWETDGLPFPTSPPPRYQHTLMRCIAFRLEKGSFSYVNLLIRSWTSPWDRCWRLLDRMGCQLPHIKTLPRRNCNRWRPRTGWQNCVWQKHKPR